MLDDFQVNGMWARTSWASGKRELTRACVKWENMQARCRDGGAFKEKKHSYEPCSCTFKNFQEFATWCQDQVGYTSDFALDKDLLIPSNKIYSPNFCVFIPHEVNNYLAEKETGLMPTGVVEYAASFAAHCRMPSGERLRITGFRTSTEAFAQYKVWKEAGFKALAQAYKDVIDSRSYDALMIRTVKELR